MTASEAHRHPAVQKLWAEWEAEYRRRTPRSEAWNRSSAASRLPAPQRQYSAGMPYPLALDHGVGARIYDIDGNEYLDYAAGWNSGMLGWGNERVAAAISSAAQRFGGTAGEPFPSPEREQVAEEICRRMPGAETVVFGVSGSEANAYALRYARAFTGREKVMVFYGAYHGMYDELVEASWPSPGVPRDTMANVVIATYNDHDRAERLIAEHARELAAVFVEPIMCAAGNIHQRDDFLLHLRRVTSEHDVLLVFDEVITGFRFAPGGGAEYYGVVPDLLALGKMLGGGLPIAAVAGRADVLGAEVMAGNTHSTNPICLAASLASLAQLTPDLYARTNALGQRLRTGLRSTLDELGLDVQVTGDATNAGLHFTAEDVRDGETGRRANAELVNLLKLGVMNRGINWSTRGFGITAAFTDADIDHTLAVFRRALMEMRPVIAAVEPVLVR